MTYINNTDAHSNSQQGGMRCQWKTKDHQTENTESSDQYYSLQGDLALLMKQQHYTDKHPIEY